jgi:uncharacterized membrane protein YcaP (DUF421 family)
MIQSMFQLGLPVAEKIIRPVIVYLVLIGFLRLFGKRELAQLNPFDLVVLLSLSNTVQNAIIGNDNSVTGGVIGALSLLSVNWLLTRILYRNPKLNAAFEGTETLLILDGELDHKALKDEALTEEELLSVLHKNNFDHFEEVGKCVLEPNGTFYLETRKPSGDDMARQKLMDAIQKLTHEVEDLRAELRGRASKV